MRSKNVCNYVHQDEIWKDHVRTEHTAGKKWPNRWGYTTETYDKLEGDLTGKDRTATDFQMELARQRGTMQDAQRIAEDMEKRNRYQRNRKLILPPISQALPPSVTVDKTLLNRVTSDREVNKTLTIKRNFPRSTSDEVGWLSKDFHFETYGNIEQRARGMHTLYKKLGWPIESTM